MHASFLSRLTLLCALLVPVCGSAAMPTPDPSFGGGHPVTQPFLGAGGVATAAFVLRDGRIVAAGSYVYRFCCIGSFPLSHAAATRYLPDGGLDTTFGEGGIIAPAPAAPSLLLRDGRFVAPTAQGIARFHSDLSPEPAMTTNGAASIAWYNGGQLLEQRDGKIVVASSVGAGTAFLTLVRFDVDGTLDTSFNHVGAMIVPHGASTNDYFAGALLQPDGKIVVAATSTVDGVLAASVLRFLPDGTPDASFGANGRVLVANAPDTSYVYTAALAMQPGGRFLVAGVRRAGVPSDGGNVSLVMAAVTASGALESSFGSGGRFVYDAPMNAIVDGPRTLMQPGGETLALFVPNSGPLAQRPVVLRVTPDGKLDTSFGASGIWSPSDLRDVRAMALQANGQLLLTGVATVGIRGDFAVARYSIGASPAVEYYHAALDRYFVTLDPMETADLDAGIHPGWARTGNTLPSFGAAPAAPAGFVPVCRFYIPPEHGDSHFFSASATECAEVQAKVHTDPNFSGYVLESPNAFYAALPDPVTGACPDATIPVYRLWNQRADSNHRYVIDRALKAQMVARGYVAEGYGPDAVAMCTGQRAVP